MIRPITCLVNGTGPNQLKVRGEHCPVRSWGESHKNVVVVAAPTLHSFDACIARVLEEACLLFLRTRCNGLRTGSMS